MKIQWHQVPFSVKEGYPEEKEGQEQSTDSPWTLHSARQAPCWAVGGRRGSRRGPAQGGQRETSPPSASWEGLSVGRARSRQRVWRWPLTAILQQPLAKRSLQRISFSNPNSRDR